MIPHKIHKYSINIIHKKKIYRIRNIIFTYEIFFNHMYVFSKKIAIIFIIFLLYFFFFLLVSLIFKWVEYTEKMVLSKHLKI